jgi:quinol monooxygenase YgiN
MHCLLVWLTVTESNNIAKVASLLTEAGRLSRQEPGCLRFEVYHSQVDPSRFLLCEHWASPEALAQHRLAQAYTQIYQPQVLPLIQREGHVSTLLT